MARRYSASPSDAEDAYQSAIEKLLTKPPVAENGDVMPWLCTVVRNEALTIRRRQKRVVDGAFDRVTEQLASELEQPDELAVEREQAAIGKEALLRLSADQARCLLLRAEGMSYAEISQTTGFKYAKVHRSLFEGRRVYRGLLGRIESGAECRRLEPTLSLITDGELTGEQRRDAELHLENCLSCRGTLRDYALAPRDVAAVFPVGTGAVGLFGQVTGQISDQAGAAWSWFNDRVLAQLAGGPSAEATMVKKAALVTAATASVLVGGATVERVASGDADAPSAARAARAVQVSAPTPPTAAAGEGDTKEASQKRRNEPRERPRAATEEDVVQTQTSSPPAGSPVESQRRAQNDASARPVEVPSEIDPESLTGVEEQP